MRIRSALIAAALPIAAPAAAHHSNAALDMEGEVEISGTVVEYTLRNPHSYVGVESVDDSGETVVWEVQMGSTLSMTRRGWDQDTLSLGDSVVIRLHQARDGRPYGLITAMQRNGVPISYERQPPPRVPARTTTLEGVWMLDADSLAPDYPGGLDELTSRDLRLTEQARVARDAFDQDSMENPELNCITKPTPGGLIYTDVYPLEIEFLDEQQIAMIRVQYFDQERTVYMDGREHPPADQRTHEGHSIGWWENNTLVVDTRNFADDRSPYQNGIPSGAQKHVIERYRLNDGGTNMTLEFFLEDPEYILGSLTHTRDLFYSPHIEMTPFNCDLEATRRYLPDE